jgi:hypothetical protein
LTQKRCSAVSANIEKHTGHMQPGGAHLPVVVALWCVSVSCFSITAATASSAGAPFARRDRIINRPQHHRERLFRSDVWRPIRDFSKGVVGILVKSPLLIIQKSSTSGPPVWCCVLPLRWLPQRNSARLFEQAGSPFQHLATETD